MKRDLIKIQNEINIFAKFENILVCRIFQKNQYNVSYRYLYYVIKLKLIGKIHVIKSERPLCWGIHKRIYGQLSLKFRSKK